MENKYFERGRINRATTGETKKMTTATQIMFIYLEVWKNDLAQMFSWKTKKGSGPPVAGLDFITFCIHVYGYYVQSMNSHTIFNSPLTRFIETFEGK